MADRIEAGYWQRLRQHSLNRRRVLRGGVTFVTGGIALGLFGCGGSSSDSAARSRPADRATAVGAAVTGTAALPAGATAIPARDLKTGGTIHVAIQGGSASLDPIASGTFQSQWRASFHYSRLFRFASGLDPQTSLSREPVPDLVSGWEVTPDGLTYTMQLRRDAMFHPPLSRPLTAADVKASWDSFLASPTNISRTVLAPIVERLTTPDDATLVFTLRRPYAWFLNKLANPNYPPILSKEAVTGTIDAAQQPIGTGPWIYGGLTPTAHTWTRNPTYFVKGIPYADGIQQSIIGDYQTQLAQFSAGKLDLLSGVSGVLPQDVELVQKAAPGSRSVAYVPTGLSFLFFANVQDPASPFKDPRVRQAASVAVDRQALIDTIYSGRGVWANIVPPGLGKWFLDPQSTEQGSSARWFKPDLKAAKQLLAAAGHSNTEFKFLYVNTIYGDVFYATGAAIGRMLAEAGFKLSVVQVDYLSVYINNGQGIFNKGAPPNTIVYALQSPFSSPDDFLTGMLTRDGSRNHDLLDDPDLAALVQKQAVELDENKRLQLVYDIQRAHAEKMYYPPIILAKAHAVMQPWVQNFFVADDSNFGTESYAYLSVNNR
ncbi:MAG: ABC transporter substrate-binding protein [Dehalococcoidia bacterium]